MRACADLSHDVELIVLQGHPKDPLRVVISEKVDSVKTEVRRTPIDVAPGDGVPVFAFVCQHRFDILDTFRQMKAYWVRTEGDVEWSQ